MDEHEQPQDDPATSRFAEPISDRPNRLQIRNSGKCRQDAGAQIARYRWGRLTPVVLSSTIRAARPNETAVGDDRPFEVERWQRTYKD